MTADVWCGKTLDGHIHEFRWESNTGMGACTRNPNGTTGWVRVFRSSGGDMPPGYLRRVHKCAHAPCRAISPPSKYGIAGPPTHAQEVDAADAIFDLAVPSSVSLRSGHIPPAAAMSLDCPQLRRACPQLRRDCAAVAEQSKVADSAHKVFQAIVELGRRIRTPRLPVGYSFFVLLGLCKQIQPMMWEGKKRNNLMRQFAPWALTSAVAACAVDGLVCCMRSLPSGRAELFPVSEDLPLAECRHFVACHTMTTPLQCEGDSIQAFYGRLGVVLLSTDMDGDCALDTACKMLGVPSTASRRDELRREIGDYLLERHECPWMHQLLAVCGELPMKDVERLRSGGESCVEDVERFRSGGESSVEDVERFRSGGGSSAVAENGDDSQANASMPQPKTTSVNMDEIEAVETVEALKWATGVADHGIIHGLLASLPEWSLKEQIFAYRSRNSTLKAMTHMSKIKVDPKNLSVRDAVAQAFEEYLRSCGILCGERLPRGRLKEFVDRRLDCPKRLRNPEKCVRRWHRAWMQAGKLKTAAGQRRKRIIYAGALPQSRRRRFGAGKVAQCNWVREGLFEWFVSMRYSIDWRKYNSSLRSVGRFKAIGRFPVAVLKDKAKQLLQEYLRVSFMAGRRQVGVAIDWKWLKRLQIE